MLRVVHNSSIEGGEGLLVVVRTRARASQLEEAGRHGDRVSLGTCVTTLPDLVRRLARRRTHLRAELSDRERALLVDDLARVEARPPLRGVPGLASWLAALFTRLKQGDVFSVERAFESFRSLDREDPGTKEALRLFGAYQDRLVSLGLYDEDGLYLEVARDLDTPELPPGRLQVRRERLVVEGFYQTNVVERAIFEKLFAAFAETHWLVDVPGPGGPAAAVLADLEVGGRRLPGDLAWLESRGADLGAFAAAEPSREGPVPVVAVAPDERTEARFLASRAAAIVRADPAADVVIAFPSDRAAAPLMLEACADAGLPLVASAERSVLEHAPAVAFFDVLDLSARDFDRDRVVAALRAAPSGVDAGGARLRAHAVDRVARKAAVLSGAASWRRRLARLAEDRPDEAASVAPVRAGMEALFDLIPPPERRLPLADFVTRARDLHARFGFGEGDRVPEGGLDPARIQALTLDARARAAIPDVLDAYETAAARLGIAERAWSAHVDGLRALAAATPLRPPRPLARGATLLGMRELRGLVTDHLLVGGLTEDALPGPRAASPLLDELDAALAGAHVAEARSREAEHLLAQALASPRRSLVLARPALRDGCEALPALALETALSGVRHGTADVAGELAAAPESGRARGDAALAWRRVSAESSRSDPVRPGRFEGMLEEAAAPLVTAGEDAFHASASAFEDFVKCPQLSFFKRVLRLKPRRDADHEVTPLDRGSVLHRILQRFHERAAASAPAPEDRARLLDGIAREEIARLPYDGLYAEVFADSLRRGLLDDGEPPRPGILRAYLDHEGRRADGFRPGFFEARFGRVPPGVDPESALARDPIALGEIDAAGRRLPILLSGSIDRVDLAGEGDGTIALVLDYKTGERGSRRETYDGLLFQLPLYAHVVPALLEGRAPGRVRPVAAAYYRILDPGSIEIDEPLADESLRGRIARPRIKLLPDGGFDRLVADVVRRARDVAQAYARGRFHPTAIDKVCAQCDFRAVCRGRGESARIGAMPASERFAQLEELVPREKKGGRS
jgi:RecB family exonuclease